jgi:hypothetical protein
LYEVETITSLVLDFILGTGYDYPDLPGLGNNNEKLGLP